MTSRVLDRAAGVLARRIDRRNLLGRSAVVGSALLVAPIDFALRPKTAYAAVCGCNGSSCACGSPCCDGWTEFCCTLNGANRCPDGTVSGGWWKVDGSNFCGGGPRYYLDCNSQCGGCPCGSGGICSNECSGTNCGCANGDCNNRATGCVRFRYGQCHQDTPCLGPIVCRVVTCVAPWIFDPACGTTSRTSESTRFHHRPCLDEKEPFGAVDMAIDVGGAVRVTGWAIDQSPSEEPTRVDIYVDNVLVTSQRAETPRADVGAAYPGFGDRHGFDVTVAASPGRRLVCVHANDPATGLAKWIGFGYPELFAPDGRIDTLQTFVDDSGVRILVVGGWAQIPAHNPQSPTIQLAIDGVAVYEGVTSFPRADVASARPGAGPTLGFVVSLPIAADSQQISLSIVYPDRRVELLQIGTIPSPTPREG